MIKKFHRVFILIYTKIQCVNGNNRYIYIDFQAVLKVQDKTKTANYVKAQAVSFIGFKYKNRRYQRANWGSL